MGNIDGPLFAGNELDDFFKTIQYCHREACPVISTINKEYQTVLEFVTSIGY
jgi:hypothetical protein